MPDYLDPVVFLHPLLNGLMNKLVELDSSIVVLPIMAGNLYTAHVKMTWSRTCITMGICMEVRAWPLMVIQCISRHKYRVPLCIPIVEWHTLWIDRHDPAPTWMIHHRPSQYPQVDVLLQILKAGLSPCQ